MGNYSLKNITLGIGIGLVISSMVNISMVKKELTVDEIKNEAVKRNLIVLTKEDILNNQTPTVTPTIAPTPKTEPAPVQGTAAKPEKAASNPTPTGTATAGKVAVNIKRGMSSESIADLLKESGLIKDTKAFLKRLGEVNKEDKLKVGSFEIPKGSGYDDIIKILTK